MKKTIMNSRSLIKTLVAGLFLATTITACSNKDNDLVLPAANLSVTHASHVTGAFDLFVNADKASKESIKFANTTGYMSIYSGKNKFTLIHLYAKIQLITFASINLIFYGYSRFSNAQNG